MSEGDSAGRALPTALLHGRHWPAAGFDGGRPGIFRASTVVFPCAADFRSRDWTRKDRFIYGLHGTPTTFELEERVAILEGGRHSLLCPSGLAAIALVYVALLKPGEELLVPVNVYSANRALIMRELVEWGIAVRLYDPTDPDSLSFSSQTRLVWIEAPCSITFEFPDIRAVVARARAAGVLTALDSTWGAGIAYRPFDLEVDIAVQSLTKFASGGEVMMGAVTCADKDLYDILKLCAMRLGQSVSAMDAASVLGGLDSLPLRYQAQDAATRRLLEEVRVHEAVAQVLHPSLEGAPGHAFWRRDCRTAAGIFSLVLQARHVQQDVDRFLDALSLFRIGFGWGGARSLVLPQGRDVVGVRPIEGELLRFAVGLEDVDDLVADLARGFRALMARDGGDE